MEVIDDPDWKPQTTSVNENLSKSEEGNEIVAPDKLATNQNANKISTGKEKTRKIKINFVSAEWSVAKKKSLREQRKAYVRWNRTKDKKGERAMQRGERKMVDHCNSKSCKKSKIR